MQNCIKQFSVNDVTLYGTQDENMDFAIVEIWALADGNNTHRNPISKDVLEKFSNTFKGKFITAKYDKWIKDAKGHEVDEVIVGYIDPRDEISFKTKFVPKDRVEKEFVVVKALLSKIYAKDIVDMFRVDNGRSVSCEFSCKTLYDENELGRPIDESGAELNIDNPILEYNIHSITILGKKINPSVAGTEIQVKQFAKEYSEINEAKELAEKLIAFAEKLNQTSNNDDNNKDKEDNMEEKDLSQVEPIETLSESEKDKEDENIVMTEELSDENNDEVIKDEESKDDKEMSCVNEDVEQPMEMEENVEEVEMGCDKEMSCGEDKEMGCNKEMSEVEQPNEEVVVEKNFSIEDYLSDDIKIENTELFDTIKKMSADELVETIFELTNQNVDLKRFQEERIAMDKEVRLSQIMSIVKNDLNTKDFSELQEEGKTLSYEQLDGFENKVKAFAYEATKDKQDKEQTDEIMRFGGHNSIEMTQPLTADDVFKKYL